MTRSRISRMSSIPRCEAASISTTSSDEPILEERLRASFQRKHTKGVEMRFWSFVVAVAVVAGVAAGGGAGQSRVARDDTSWLQARLDAGGGRIFLPKLPNGACYATRGL